MTKREIFEGIKAFFEADTSETLNETLTATDVVEFCEKELATLDRKAEKAKEIAAKRKNEGDELSAMLLDALTEEFATIPEIVEKVGNPDLTVNKAVYRLNALEKAGKATKTEVTVEGTEGQKSRKLVAFALAAPVEE